MADRGPLLRVEKVSKHFGGVKAVDEVSLEVNAGEVVGIIGDNGAGKSTLIKMISGVYVPDGGKIYFDGQETEGKSPREMREMGLETIYQDLALADNLDAGANIFLGREPVKSGFFNTVDNMNIRREARSTLKKIALEDLNLKKKVRDLSGGQRQGVAIARAVHWNAKLFIMDEPTASLDMEEVENIYKLIRDLKRQNMAIILISHNLQDIFEVADRTIVLRLSRKVAEKNVIETDMDEIVKLIVGEA
jgi:ABC-type sugar transport system ATPase subunit